MHPSADIELASSRRRFLLRVSLAAGIPMLIRANSSLGAQQPTAGSSMQADPLEDQQRMRSLAAWTALTFETPNPVPFGAEIVHSDSGRRLSRASNAVRREQDPSAHAEIRTIRLACRTLNSHSLRGYTLYTTCEPCPMCMACSLWAGLDRVVYGATIADAAAFGHQILIPAAEIVKRSDMSCVVDGPVEHELCLALFTNPKMRATFEKWKRNKS
ncbi:MAG TPA: nucleoside deaminase [Steroidobacteraceae bacterium]|jgi:tRNA(Arg) A34 adenosine deaminase TadA